MVSVEGQDPVHSLNEDEDPSLDYSVEPDLPVWDEEDGFIDSEEVVVPEADPADVAEQHRDVEA
ncbi:hypothetical protein SPF06_05385 [Sinomonas sp. JGH33]|uniref:Uncharacterized protein n=1 Tax=Sinomonas terricola TaxID=3110330 RepID=A0ABU5T3A6_9MICC|nr:hypothetical protein [Sinomonas sp. JGH33]MEA5454153.1 hypothetical protein [Sinomonas sp. JGH33]